MSRKVALSSLFLVVCLSFSLGDGTYHAEASDEICAKELDEDSFNEVIDSSKFALVIACFSSAGLPLQRLKPEFEAAAKRLKEIDDNIVLANVNAEENKALGQKFGVQGFPTLKWIVGGSDGSVVDYKGGRSADDIVKWVQKKSGPPAVTLKESADLSKARTDADVFLVGYFDELEGDEYDAFTNLARGTDDVAIYETTSKAVANELGLQSAPSFAVGRNDTDGLKVAVSKGHSAFDDHTKIEEQLAAFLLAEKLPVYLEFNSGSTGRIFGSGIMKQIILIGSPKQLYSDKSFTAALKAAHSQHKGKVVFVTANLEEPLTENIVKYFGASNKSDTVQVIAYDADRSKKFYMRDALTSEALAEFVRGFTSGELVPEYKSEPIPSDPIEDDVHVVVGKSFDDVVMDENKDVFLEVYAPWCGHCKQLAPTWSKLGRRFKKVDTVTVAKMDGTTNEHAAIEGVKSFPTLLFFPAGETKGIEYDRPSRELKDLTKFIMDKAKTDPKLPKKGKKDNDSAKDEL